MSYQASPAQVNDEARIDVLVAYGREMDDDRRDQRAVVALQKQIGTHQQRMWARRRRLARYADQLCGSTHLRRHYDSTPEVLPHCNPKALR